MSIELCQSPLERKFYHYFINCRCCDWIDSDGPIKAAIVPQHPVGKYHLDFLVSLQVDGHDPVYVGVEIDGHEFHEKTKAQAARDKQRDRFILQQGIPVIRFTGSEVYADAESCTYETYLALRCRSQG